MCNLNVQFTKLYVGGIPKDKTREQIFSAFSQEVEKLTDVVIQEPDDVSSLNGQNRGSNHHSLTESVFEHFFRGNFLCVLEAFIVMSKINCM